MPINNELRKAAAEIAVAGHAGWGNVCTDALNEIERLSAALAAQATSPRGTDAQILKERELTVSAIQGAMACGYQNGEYPPADAAWLRPFWELGRRDAEIQGVMAARATELMKANERVKNLQDEVTYLIGCEQVKPSKAGHSEPAPVRQPLNRAQIEKIVIEVCDAIYPQDDTSYSEADSVFYGAFTHAVEAAHGLTAQGGA